MYEYNAVINILGEESVNYKVKVTNNSNNKTIYYVEPDNLKTVNIYDYDNNILRRDNDEIYMELNFNDNDSYMIIKDLDKKIILDMKLLDISNDDDIKIKYLLNDKEYIYEIIKEVM